jgi:hypothetical protein
MNFKIENGDSLDELANQIRELGKAPYLKYINKIKSKYPNITDSQIHLNTKTGDISVDGINDEELQSILDS